PRKALEIAAPRILTELVAATAIKLVHAAEQGHVALADEFRVVDVTQASALGHRQYERHVGLHEFDPRGFSAGSPHEQLGRIPRGQPAGPDARKDLGDAEAGIVQLKEESLLFSRRKRNGFGGGLEQRDIYIRGVTPRLRHAGAVGRLAKQGNRGGRLVKAGMIHEFDRLRENAAKQSAVLNAETSQDLL